MIILDPRHVYGDLLGSMISMGAVPSGIVYPTTGAQWATMAGFANALTAYWRFTRATAGVEEDIVGAADLTPISAPNQGVFDAALNSVCLEFPDFAGRRMEAADSTVLEVGTSDFLYWEVCRAPAVSDANLRALASKRSSAAGNAGWNAFSQFNAHTRAFLDGGASTDQEEVTEAWTTTPRMFALVVDRLADNFRLHVWRDGSTTSSAGQAIAAADLTGAGVFAIGNDVASASNSAARRVSAAGMIIGTGARGFSATNLSNLATAMGVP